MFMISALLSLWLLGAAQANWVENCSLRTDFNKPPNCSDCDVLDDKSTYYTPQLYYQFPNGTFVGVKDNGMTVTYAQATNPELVTAFPPGFRMTAGDPLSRFLNLSEPVFLDGLGFIHQPVVLEQEGQDLRITVYFPSCWNGRDIQRDDNAHVAYPGKNIEQRGDCPASHPVRILSVSVAVSYTLNSVPDAGATFGSSVLTSSDGRFVFAHGDTTGFGFYASFVEGWGKDTLHIAIPQCVGSADRNDCLVLNQTAVNEEAQHCPGPKPAGLLAKLPGCVRITSGPTPASLDDINCAGNSESSVAATSTAASSASPSKTPSPAPVLLARGSTVSRAVAPKASIVGISGSYVYNGCWTQGIGGLALTGDKWADPKGVTVESCVTHCSAKGFGLAGLEYGQVCYCGAQLVHNSTLVDDKQCGIPCRGNRKEVCGGEGRLTVYLSG